MTIPDLLSTLYAASADPAGIPHALDEMAEFIDHAPPPEVEAFFQQLDLTRVRRCVPQLLCAIAPARLTAACRQTVLDQKDPTLDHVAFRISEHLWHCWMHDTNKALALGLVKPQAWVAEGDEGVVRISYSQGSGITYLISPQVARAYLAWLNAGNIGPHFSGPAIRQEITP